MSETIIYLKARFPTADAAGKTEEELRVLLDDLVLLRQEFRSVRQQKSRSCENRRAELRHKHPKAWVFVEEELMVQSDRYIKENAIPQAKDDPHLNCVVDGVPEMIEDYNLFGDGRYLCLSCEVNGCTSWEGIARWLRANGAQDAQWIYDEDVDPFASIQLSPES
jgi:hypothetical protein